MNDHLIPPLGLRPRVAWEADRMLEIREAIERYTAAFRAIPEEWIKEYNELAASIQEGKS